MRCSLAVSGFCPLCYAGVRGRAFYRGHAGVQTRSRARKRCSMLRRPADRDFKEVIDLHLGAPGSFDSTYPRVWAFLTATAFEDGESRQPGTILLFVEQGRLKCCLNDRECGEVAFLAGTSVEDLWTRLEAGMGSGDLDWRPAKGKGQKSR